MSTDLYDQDGVALTRYARGRANGGGCGYQITQGNACGYVQISAVDLLRMAAAFIEDEHPDHGPLRDNLRCLADAVEAQS